MNTKTKITEIKETYIKNTRAKGATGGPTFEEKSFTRYREVHTVTGWSRFGHYMLDLVFYYMFTMVLAVPVVLILMAIGVKVENIAEGNGLYNILDRLISWLVLYPGYYILFESTIQSTPGKIILGRIVVDEYGEKPKFLTIVKRSYSRIVPFEALSCLSDQGWHDTWTDTFVIRKKDLVELQLAVKAQEFGTTTEL